VDTSLSPPAAEADSVDASHGGHLAEIFLDIYALVVCFGSGIEMGCKQLAERLTCVGEILLCTHNNSNVSHQQLENYIHGRRWKACHSSH